MRDIKKYVNGFLPRYHVARNASNVYILSLRKTITCEKKKETSKVIKDFFIQI